MTLGWFGEGSETDSHPFSETIGAVDVDSDMVVGLGIKPTRCHDLRVQSTDSASELGRGDLGCICRADNEDETRGKSADDATGHENAIPGSTGLHCGAEE